MEKNDGGRALNIHSALMVRDIYSLVAMYALIARGGQLNADVPKIASEIADAMLAAREK